MQPIENRYAEQVHTPKVNFCDLSESRLKSSAHCVVGSGFGVTAATNRSGVGGKAEGKVGLGKE